MITRYAPNQNGTMWSQRQGAYVKFPDAEADKAAAVAQARREAVEKAAELVLAFFGSDPPNGLVNQIRALAEGGGDA